MFLVTVWFGLIALLNLEVIMLNSMEIKSFSMFVLQHTAKLEQLIQFRDAEFSSSDALFETVLPKPE